MKKSHSHFTNRANLQTLFLHGDSNMTLMISLLRSVRVLTELFYIYIFLQFTTIIKH